MAFPFKKLPENSEIENEVLTRNINNMFYLCIYMICSECIMLISFIGIKDKLPPRIGLSIWGCMFFCCCSRCAPPSRYFGEKSRRCSATASADTGSGIPSDLYWW